VVGVEGALVKDDAVLDEEAGIRLGEEVVGEG
jgi:hypothetical protein